MTFRTGSAANGRFGGFARDFVAGLTPDQLAAVRSAMEALLPR